MIGNQLLKLCTWFNIFNAFWYILLRNNLQPSHICFHHRCLQSCRLRFGLKKKIVCGEDHSFYSRTKFFSPNQNLHLSNMSAYLQDSTNKTQLKPSIYTRSQRPGNFQSHFLALPLHMLDTGYPYLYHQKRPNHADVAAYRHGVYMPQPLLVAKLLTKTLPKTKKTRNIHRLFRIFLEIQNTKKC